MASKSGMTEAENKKGNLLQLTPQQLKRQRERNRIYMWKIRASLSGEEFERRLEKDGMRRG
jgi:hypothetical protein